MSRISPFFALVEAVQRQIFEWEDSFFEKWHGLELGPVFHAELVSDDKDSSEHATAYQAVWCRNLREIFTQTSRVNVAPLNFIDIGSGKGKACLYAAKKMSYKKIIGIDFSEPLIAISQENAQRFGRADIVFKHADARKFFLPDARNLVFMFNPFDDVILREFIENNLEHFQQRKSIIAYANDLHRNVITEIGFATLFRNENRRISLYQWRS
jgi:SAM-dependent methyltransferase